MRLIDFRSDTLTRPTAEMRRRMAEAPVGDDVFGEDPTVRALEERVADLLGKEAALFVPSGTMANQLALRCQTDAGDEILTHEAAHVLLFERGAPAMLSGLSVRGLPGAGGIFATETLEGALRPPEMAAYGLFPPTTLLALENTHNAGGGRVWPMPVLRGVAAAARRHELTLHLDGARLWHAAIVAGVGEADIASHFDSVSVCFSKGLGAPVGSALAGSPQLIMRARRFRGMLGGAMRQAGIIAAGALFALEHQRDRLIEDHEKARRVVEVLDGSEAVDLDSATVETNIIMLELRRHDAAELAAACRSRGLLALPMGKARLRLVTHLDVSLDDAERAGLILRELLC